MSINLDAIQARADAATGGAWKAWDRGIGYEVHGPDDMPLNFNFRETFTKSDAEFVAAARTDVPALLAYARDLEAQLADLETKENTLPGFEPQPCPDCGLTFPHHSHECINA